jgi:hypothetical protein
VISYEAITDLYEALNVVNPKKRLKHNPEAYVGNKGSTQGPRLQIKSDIRETNVINNGAYSKLLRENI